MRFLFLPLLILTISSNSLLSQSREFSFKTTDIEEPDQKPKAVDLIKVADEYYFVRKVRVPGPRGYDFIIEKYDEDLKFLSSLKISGQDGNQERYIERVFELGDDLAMVYNVRSEDEESVIFKLDILDGESLISERRVALFSVPIKMAQQQHEIEVHVATSGSFFSVAYYTLAPYTRLVSRYYQFSNDGEMKSNLLEVMANETKGLKIFQTLLANNGKVYLILNNEKTSIKYEDLTKNKKNQKFKWFLYEIDGEKVNVHPIYTSTLQMDNIVISESESGDIIGGCSYLNSHLDESKDYDSFVKGLFSFRFDPTREDFEYSMIHPFSYDLVFNNWNRDMTKTILASHKGKDKKEYKLIEELKDEYDDFSDFDIYEPRKMKNGIGLNRFYLRDVFEFNNKIYVIGYTSLYFDYTGIVYTVFKSNGEVDFEGKAGIFKTIRKGQSPYYLINSNNSPTLIFPDSYKSSDSSFTVKEPYFPNDGTAFGALVFSEKNPPVRQVAFRLDQKPRIPGILLVVPTQDKSELLFLVEAEDDIFKIGRLK